MPARPRTRTRSANPLLLAGTCLLAIVGCRGRQPAEAVAETPRADRAVTVAASASAPATLAVGTPAGGLREWVGDVRRGLAGVPALAVRDAGQAQKRALDLYLTRQEYIEMYWGEGGRLTRGRELAPAIEEAENRFHILLAGLEPRFRTRRDVIGREIASLNEQYDHVLAAAATAHVVPDAHRVFAPAAAAPNEGAGR